MASVLVPVFYVFVLFGGLFIFGHFYRKRSASTLLPSPVAICIRELMYILQDNKSSPTSQDTTREILMSPSFSVQILPLPILY
jgi:translocation protein SEC66